MRLNDNGQPWRLLIGAVVLTVLAVGVLVSTTPSLAQEAAKDAQPAAKTLYQRMGGYDVIAGVVDDFIRQLGEDEAFKRFGGGRSEGSLKRTRQLIVDQVCAATGGPCVYFGRDMKSAHAGLKITQQEWDTSIKYLTNSLQKFKVGEPEQKEVLAIVQDLRKDIVEPPEEQKTQAQN